MDKKFTQIALDKMYSIKCTRLLRTAVLLAGNSAFIGLGENDMQLNHIVPFLNSALFNSSNMLY